MTRRSQRKPLKRESCQKWKHHHTYKTIHFWRLCVRSWRYCSKKWITQRKKIGHLRRPPARETTVWRYFIPLLSKTINGSRLRSRFRYFHTGSLCTLTWRWHKRTRK
jgi:hypothetical protein